MNQNDSSSFFDSRTILAIILVILTWMGWQWHLQQKYPTAFKAKEAQQSAEASKNVTDKGAKSSVQETEAPTAIGSNKNDEIAEKQADLPEELTTYSSENLSFAISSKGMGLKLIRLKKFTTREGKEVTIEGQPEGFLPFETSLLGRRDHLHFKVDKINENQFVGRAQVGGTEISKVIEIDPQNYTLNTRISAKSEESSFIGITTHLSHFIRGNLEKPSFFSPHTGDIQEFFVTSVDAKERAMITKEDFSKAISKVKVASIGTQYFTQALVDKSDIMPEIKMAVDHASQGAIGTLNYNVLNKNNLMEIVYTGFVGPKNFQLLAKVDDSLAGVVDFGMFGWIGKYILGLMKWFYSIIGNWGVAIILLTLLVRIFVLPFNIVSYKSMKAMQVIQPQLQLLREKYKDDQQKLQQEMMSLMRENKVNPLGGCLPVLLQFPIFIALYQVLNHSIELYQAPFGFWIHDLSLKDPFYVLPILMGITMFVQQKITPNTLDPMQAKVLMFMPILFSFFMLNLPSGLTLYIFISSLFAIIQQLYFMKNLNPAPAAVAK